MTDRPIPREMLADTVTRVVDQTPVLDIHTHIYPASFGELALRGVDELLTYHYLIAEVCRADRSVSPEQFYAMPPTQRADHIWRTLFLQGSPVSEALRGVLTTLSSFGLDLSTRDLSAYREYFASLTPREHIDRVFDLANVSHVVMTNNPFDAAERAHWDAGVEQDPRFLAALRVDALIDSWPSACRALNGWGYAVAADATGATAAELRRFLEDWTRRMAPVYLAMSLVDTYAYPTDAPEGRVMKDAILPHCRDTGLPLALMIGVSRQVNPALRLAGDSVGPCDTKAVERLCADNPDVRFLITLLSRENQHELAVTARKFPNLMPFGCWWFLNNPSLIEEITLMRLELLGLSMIPQHSDARVLDQLVYKWRHSRQVIASALTGKYAAALATGWRLTESELRRDVSRLLRGNFIEYAGIQGCLRSQNP